MSEIGNAVRFFYTEYLALDSNKRDVKRRCGLRYIGCLVNTDSILICRQIVFITYIHYIKLFNFTRLLIRSQIVGIGT